MKNFLNLLTLLVFSSFFVIESIAIAPIKTDTTEVGSLSLSDRWQIYSGTTLTEEILTDAAHKLERVPTPITHATYHLPTLGFTPSDWADIPLFKGVNLINQSPFLSRGIPDTFGLRLGIW